MASSPGTQGRSQTPAVVKIAATAVRERKPTRLTPSTRGLDGPSYIRSQGVDAYLRQMHEATPMAMAVAVSLIAKGRMRSRPWTREPQL